ncbi:DnaJ-domain-containing protein [Tuber magnatum]|uniref:DnaJ-domain-containing protein n=1 Tax=Tuber magnatum TaxID=42249 RepID=A0A317T0H6_9PEZI|nr:DnaJ-domain-containing protein [Tuber magnatum]
MVPVNGSTEAESIDLYEILGIESSATKVEIKKAYHKAALSSHPDKVPEHEREDAENRFKNVSQAYEILYDDEKRARYDRFGMADFTTSGGMGGMGGDVDLEEMLSHMFGMGGMGGFPGMGPMPRGPGGRKQKGKDVVQQYEVSLEELYKGKTVKLASTRNILCSLCKGSGGKDKAKAKKCATCSGRGWNQNLRQVGRGIVTQENVICVPCKGSGDVFREKDRCKKCKGHCVIEEKKVLEIYIPRGSKEGDKIVLQGEADEAPDHETGDIIFLLEEKDHNVFSRAGADLMAPLHVSLAEALTGFSRVVLKHLDGRGIQITHPKGKILRPRQALRVEGEGMPHKKGDGKGDLFLIVDIEFPKDGWIPDVNGIRKVLPEWTGEQVQVEQVDDVTFDPEGDIEDFGNADESGGGVWVDEDDDDDEDSGPQCAQQ